MRHLTLVSHPLCPYVQRAAIALLEKDHPFTRLDVDLSDKPRWFLDISPLGKVPLLIVGEEKSREVLFESSAILSYLDETTPPMLHPQEPLERARHRAWIELGSAILDGIARVYNAPNAEGLRREAERLAQLFGRVEAAKTDGQWFAGNRFTLVDAVFAPVFRYLDAFDAVDGVDLLNGSTKLALWRRALAARPSVRDAVKPDYPARLQAFLLARRSALSTLMPSSATARAAAGATG